MTLCRRHNLRLTVCWPRKHETLSFRQQREKARHKASQGDFEGGAALLRGNVSAPSPILLLNRLARRKQTQVKLNTQTIWEIF